MGGITDLFMAALLISVATVVNGDVCKTIENSWWNQRKSFEHTYPYNNPQMQAYCAQFSKANSKNPDQWTADDCYQAQENIDEAEVICTIEGGGHDTTCVPTNCAHLNQGDCDFNKTGGLCQWFTFAPKSTNPSENRGHGCYPNPCNMGGQPYNNEDYCNSDPNFIHFNLQYQPAVECTWCGSNKMGCQNKDPYPKSGCAKIGNSEINDKAKQAAAEGVQANTILTISSDDDNYAKATICANADLVLETGVTAECIWGQEGCGQEQLDAGFHYKYPMKRRRLRN